MRPDVEDRPSAFVATAGMLGRQLREAEIDEAALRRPLKRCELSRCRATCCHDGVIVGEEEARVIRQVLEDHGGQLGDYGWEMPDGGVVEAAEGGKLKTVVREAGAGELADDFPGHFPRTRCVLLDSAHRCVLQRLAMDGGRGPWFWKPLSCWMHPLVLRPAQSGRLRLTVLAAEEDRQRFASCTHCGRPEPEGEPAAAVLAEELGMLERISD